MKAGFTSTHWSDADGNPAGGCSFGRGFAVSWQNGPLGRPPERKEPNGAFVEDVIAAAKDRLDYYQTSKFKCNANDQAIWHLECALSILQERTKDREARNVEGTHDK